MTAVEPQLDLGDRLEDNQLDGVDAAGRPLASGRYWLQATWEGGDARLPLSLVR